jgi:hypothetical protein
MLKKTQFESSRKFSLGTGATTKVHHALKFSFKTDTHTDAHITFSFGTDTRCHTDTHSVAHIRFTFDNTPTAISKQQPTTHDVQEQNDISAASLEVPFSPSLSHASS